MTAWRRATGAAYQAWALARTTPLVLVLLAVAALDELASGVASTAAPAIEASLMSSHRELALCLFVVPGLASLVLEPVVFLLADRYPRAWFVRAGLTVMALAAVGAALAPGPIGLAIALSVSWVATGAGVALAQATLLDAQPTQRARTMARWTLASLAGDLAAPAVLIGCTHADVAIRGDAWRGTYAVVAGALVLGAIATMLVRFPRATGSDDDDDTPTPGLWATLRGALGDRHLMAWLLGVALCDLLDELLVVLATLHVRDNLGGGAAAQSATVAAFMIGGAVGLVALDRLLARRDERTLLVACAAACAVTLVLWLAMPTVATCVIAAIAVGATSAPLYPLAAARAYALRPGQAGLVLAASHLFTPLGLALPFVLGWVADRAGVDVAIAILLVEPIALLLLARRRDTIARCAAPPP